MGRVAYPLRLARARLRHRLGRAALVALGVAVGVGALATVLAGSLIAQDRALGREIEGLDPAQRTVRLTWGGIPAAPSEQFGTLDGIARRELQTFGDLRPFATLVYRERQVGGALVDLTAIDGVVPWVRLRSGRLPRPCVPGHCEVVQVGGRGDLPRGSGLPRVGTASLLSNLPLGSDVGLRQNPAVEQAVRYHAPALTPILVANGVSGLASTPELRETYRTYAWVLPLRPGDVRPWTVHDFAAQVDRVRSALQASSNLFELSAPVDELEAADASSTVAGRRLLLIGGEVAALLLAFTLLAASSGSRDAEAASRRLTWFGASRSQLLTVFGAEALVVAVTGTAIGWIASAGATVAIARAAGAPPGAVLSHSILSWTGVLLALVVAAACTLILLASLWPRRAQIGRFSIGPLDIAAVGALVAIVLALVRGSADPEAIAQGEGTGVVLLLLPGLVAFVAAVVCVRALGPLLRGLERAARGRRAPSSLAVLSLARNPGRSATAVAFLVVSIGLATFAAAYGSTLERNQADAAAYAVPLDALLEEDFTQGEYPLEAASLSSYRRLGPGVEPYPVTRLQADASGGGQEGTTLLGLSTQALPRLRWRSDFSNLTPSQLARRIAPRGPVELRGVKVPEDARLLELPFELRGDPLKISAAVQTEDGDYEFPDFGRARGAGVLRARVPDEARGGLLVGFTLNLPTAGTRVFTASSVGRLSLGRLRVAGPEGRTTLAGYEGWLGVSGARAVVGPRGAHLRYVVTGARTTQFRPRQPTDGKPVPVIVSPNLARAAGPGGLLPVRIVDQQLLTRVVGTAQRFPTLSGSFVVGDEQWLAAALNADVPRSGLVVEVWVDGGRRPGEVVRALAGPPYDRLKMTSRRAVEDELRSDPLARGALITLAAAALVALVLALAGLLLAVVSDLRDERGELQELEAQGAEPRDLRRHLRLRGLIVCLAGLAGGLATGAVLGTLVVGVVQLTAGAQTPEPPLRFEVDWTLLAVGLAGFLAAAIALVAVVTWTAFRSPVPSAIGESA